MQARLATRAAPPSVMGRAAFRPLVMETKPEVARTLATAVMQRQQQTAPAVPGVMGNEVRSMSSWRLRPYAAAGTQGALPMTSLSAGFSKVGLSLLVLPWKALPMALLLAPCCWVLPAFYRLIFTNSMRATTASAFSGLMALTVSFAPVPVFENLFSDFAFYSVALVTSFFTYMFFPELFLNDFMAYHFLVLFMIPLIPLAFTYMPMMHARSYFTL